MATYARYAAVRVENATNSGRRIWEATATVQDTPAGGYVDVALAESTGGLTPPGSATNKRLRFYTSTGLLIIEYNMDTATWNGSTQRFHFRDTGLPGGVPRSGTVEVAIYVKLDGVGGYEYESDGSPATGGGSESITHRGFIRGTTTATVASDRAAAGRGANPTLSLDLADPGFVAQPVTLTLGPDTGNSAAATDGHSRLITVGTQFPAAETAYTPQVAFPEPPGFATGVGWTDAVVTSAGDVTVDPRMYVSAHFQVDDNVYGAGKHVATLSMESTESGFIWPVVLNSLGDPLAGVEGRHTLDPEHPGTTLGPQTFTTDTAGIGSPVMEWTVPKPSGFWNWLLEVTNPAGYTADYLVGEAQQFAMLQFRSRFGVIVGGGPNDDQSEGRHWTPGQDLLLGMSVFDVRTNNLRVPDSGTTGVIVARFRADLGQVEGLDVTVAANGVSITAVAWSQITSLAAAERIPVFPANLFSTTGDSRVFVNNVGGALTADWEPHDLFLVGVCEIEGTPYWAFGNLEITGKFSQHDMPLIRMLA